MDTLTIKVFKADDLSGDYEVDLAGHISLPLVGEVEAANLTTAELDEKLTEALGEKYFEHPDVSVAIKQSTAHVVTVDGAVNQAGQFPMAGPTDPDPGSVACAGNFRRRQCPPGRGVPDHRRAATGGSVRSDRDPAWRSARSANLSGRHRRGRRIEDQGSPEADLPDASRCWRFSGHSDAGMESTCEAKNVNTSLPVPNDGSWPIGPMRAAATARAAASATIRRRTSSTSRRLCGSCTTGAGWCSARSRSGLRAHSRDPADRGRSIALGSRSRRTRRPFR